MFINSFLFSALAFSSLELWPVFGQALVDRVSGLDVDHVVMEVGSIILDRDEWGSYLTQSRDWSSPLVFLSAPELVDPELADPELAAGAGREGGRHGQLVTAMLRHVETAPDGRARFQAKVGGWAH